jgi:hypothetical protein
MILETFFKTEHFHAMRLKSFRDKNSFRDHGRAGARQQKWAIRGSCHRPCGSEARKARHVADALGMTSVLIHPLAGALSAYGIGLADVIAMREAAVEAPLTAALAASLRDEAFRPWGRSARAELLAQSAPSAAPEGIGVTRRVHLRYAGTNTPLQVPNLPQPAQGAPTEPGGPASPEPDERVQMFTAGQWATVPLYRRLRQRAPRPRRRLRHRDSRRRRIRRRVIPNGIG